MTKEYLIKARENDSIRLQRETEQSELISESIWEISEIIFSNRFPQSVN